MPDAIAITPLHILYLVGVIVILAVMVLRRDTPAVCIAFLFLLGVVGLGNVAGGVQVVFKAILYAATQFMEVIATIALVTALSKCLTDLGSDYLLMTPMARVMKTPALTWWILGFAMLLFSLFLWPSPSVALVGAIMLPFAVKTGLNPLLAAMSMNLFGHGAGLSSDFFIQGAPDITATAAGVDTASVMKASVPLWGIMCVTTIAVAFWMMRRDLKQNPTFSSAEELYDFSDAPQRSRLAAAIAILIPTAFLIDVVLMVRLGITGGDATALVAGTALILMAVITIANHGLRAALEVSADHLRDGFIFAIKIFAPVIVIAGFFFLGSESFAQTVLGTDATGLLNDIGLWLAEHVPMSRASVALLETAVGTITGLDGSGFSGLPLCGALAQTFAATGSIDVPTLAALGQISTVWVGGGTIIPWGCVPVAAICGIKASDLAKKNLIPVVCGLAATTAAAIVLM